MRLIDADAFKSWHCHWCEHYQKCDGTWCDWGAIIGLDAQPTIDAVPVIHCRDCARYQHGTCTLNGAPFSPDARYVSEDGYCSSAESRIREIRIGKHGKDICTL